MDKDTLVKLATILTLRVVIVILHFMLFPGDRVNVLDSYNDIYNEFMKITNTK